MGFVKTRVGHHSGERSYSMCQEKKGAPLFPTVTCAFTEVIYHVIRPKAQDH